MATEQAGQDQGQEHEGDEGQNEELVKGLEDHEAGPDHEEKPGPGSSPGKADAQGKAATAETGAHGAGAAPEADKPSNAVTAINGKVASARTKMWERGEKRRLKEQKARGLAQAGGKDWTALKSPT